MRFSANAARLATTDICAATDKWWSAAGRTSRSCPSIQAMSWCLTTIRASCSTLRGQDFSWAARFGSAMEFRWAFPSGHGDGAITASIGAGTACLLTTSGGDEGGTIAWDTLTPMQAFTGLDRAIAYLSIMNWKGVQCMNAARNEKAAAHRKNTTDMTITDMAMIMVAIMTGVRTRYVLFA